jgi:PcfJ-like protein
MGRRPKIWSINARSSKSRWHMSGYKKCTNDIAEFDIDKLELLPFTQSKKHITNPRWQRTNAPIDNFLMDQVGRDYDEVFSELTEKIPKKYQHRHCVNLADYKMPSSFHPSLKRWFFNDYSHRRDDPTDGFYVDLDTNTLGFIEKIGKYAIQKEEREKPAYKPFDLEKFKIRVDYAQNYVFQQLLTYEDFEKEAKIMRHCIRSYWWVCTHLSSKRSIWSLTEGDKKALTIELSDSIITQARGLYNRKATEDEKLAVTKWAAWLKLTIAEYAF